MVTAVETPPPGLPSDATIMGRAGGENFTVASRLLPGRVRTHLLAFYGYARLVDYLGDDYRGDRVAALDWASAQLDAALAIHDAPPAGDRDGPSHHDARNPSDTRNPSDVSLHPLIAAAAASALAVGAGAAPLRQLIRANQMDQTVTSYATWDDLVGYCRLSADPVGHLVLAAFDLSTPPRRLLSDAVCTALQVAEHLQDVAEDAVAGRIYLPAEDCRRFGVDGAELVALATSGGPAPASVRALVAFEAWRARRLLDRGSALVATLPGMARLAVAGFVAGGYGALDAVAATGYDPFAGATRPSKTRVAAHLVGLVRHRHRHTGSGRGDITEAGL